MWCDLVQRALIRIAPRARPGAAEGCAAAWLVLVLVLPALEAGSGWVAETANFRVLAADAEGLGALAVAEAAADLEAIRTGFHLAGLGYPLRADGRLEVLLVPSRADLHALLREPPASRTRGITVRGPDRNYIVVPWLDWLEPRTTLAHEYAHQLNPSGWPPWLNEGRAIYLARRTEPRLAQDTITGLIAMLDRAPWDGWSELVDAEANGPVTRAELFQAKSWLLVHWLASWLKSPALLSPERVARVLAGTAEGDLGRALQEHLVRLRKQPVEWLVPLAAAETVAQPRMAAAWEIALLEAEVWLALQRTDLAEPALEDLLERFPEEARVRAAYATVQLVRGRLDRAAEQFGLAVHLGDTRARTAYRHALLLMRPGALQPDRGQTALGHALMARDRMPQVPEHHLAVVHARMLLEQWGTAFRDLQPLLRFQGWSDRASREAAEIRRRMTQSLRAVPAPFIESRVPALPATLLPRPILAAPSALPAKPARARGRRIWPPYGTWLVHGRIAAVRCSDRHQTVILHSPYQRIVLRVNPDQPPDLINRPFKSATLPCKSRGWVAAIAYRRIRGEGEVRGQIVGIRF